ncbi:hypothetical protein SADUNF_Sadunf03G0109900 [Salix dunnii]|uniref:Uncharacterized protein n=1 Tax=Salix dunnii TaxID=1413687 RepID=A0A835N229_9ROSI|nr:hypothetical protein SADUNF_Sadunf03G0109900 [Salix dunnii]
MGNQTAVILRARRGAGDEGDKCDTLVCYSHVQSNLTGNNAHHKKKASWRLLIARFESPSSPIQIPNTPSTHLPQQLQVRTGESPKPEKLEKIISNSSIIPTVIVDFGSVRISERVDNKIRLS